MPTPSPTGPGLSGERRRASRRAVGDWIPNAWIIVGGGSRVPVVVRDITCEGVGFETKIPLDPGMVITLGLDCPVWAEPVECRIVHQVSNGERKEHVRYRHGARFLAAEARKARIMAELL